MRQQGMTAMREERNRWALGALSFAIVAPLAYLAQRLLDQSLAGEPDALSMLRQGRAAYPWRAAVAAFWGGMAAIVVSSLAKPRASAAPHFGHYAALAAGVVGVAVLVLAWLFP